MHPEPRARTLEVGGYGWRRRDWDEDFYPEDLPPDWRLAFYANEFQTVCVPAAYWREAPADIAGRSSSPGLCFSSASPSSARFSAGSQGCSASMP